ncbi:hypothetical protein LOAG_13478 [Loa loa]|uniref:Uncharacterized protein n=1 Tax=Loa loa TaxID=7209 RepID=A0A1S0TJY3_LOALO|nr:hypothetical protein LOAG_13478 [Loa loa]EFO15037.1 hypothetical protein LOAG_13478 [Loa loa]
MDRLVCRNKLQHYQVDPFYVHSLYIRLSTLCQICHCDYTFIRIKLSASNSMNMYQLCQKEADQDGLLYIVYTSQSDLVLGKLRKSQCKYSAGLWKLKLRSNQTSIISNKRGDEIL